jgi:hypothetical protein
MKQQGAEENSTKRSIVYDLHSSSDIIEVIKSKKMKREVHVARMGDNKNA